MKAFTNRATFPLVLGLVLAVVMGGTLLTAAATSPAPDDQSSTAPPSPAVAPGVPLSPSPALKSDSGVGVWAALGALPLYFVENRGLLDDRVAYYVQGRDTTVYFTSEGVTFALSGPAPVSLAGAPASRHAVPSVALRAGPDSAEVRQRWALKLEFVGANAGVRPQGHSPTPAVVSYFKGPREQWHTGLPTYASLVYPDLWPGIDLVYSGSTGRLKYTFLVKPGADPGQIKLAYRGATAVWVAEAGHLEVMTPAGGISDDTPVSYQELNGRRLEIPTAYVLEPGRVSELQVYGFSLGAYDRSLPLVLDPVVIVYAGYIGGAYGDTIGTGIAVDSAGNAYVTGYTQSSEATFPVKVGPDLTYNGGTYDAFVAKVKADGTGLVYAGYIGGADRDWAKALAVDTVGNAYITGVTNSTEATFPVTVGPGVTYKGSADAFVAKVSADGTRLIYAGYIGGAGTDEGWGIAVDAAGNAYVTGVTGSTEATFPVLVGPDLTFNGGYADVFVAKVKADGTGLVYAGYIGGGGFDWGYGIAVDRAGAAYVTGYTNSTEATFPVTAGPDLTFNGGASDAFVAKVKADGTGLVYAGYIGGALTDEGWGIAVDAAGNAYVTGVTGSREATFPVLVGPDLTYNGGKRDAFVAKVKADGTGLVYAGYIGGRGWDEGAGVAVDAAGNAYVTGRTYSRNFPVSVGPDLTYNGGGDAFVAKVKADGTGLVYAGYIGGVDFDSGRGIAVDAAGNAYITGRTSSTEATFPVTVGPDLTFNGISGNAFVVKIAALIVGADLDLVEVAVSDPPPSARLNASFAVTDTALNQGTGDAGASTTRYYLALDAVRNSGDKRLRGSRSVPVLGPGEDSTGTVSVKIPSTTLPGTYYLLACADDRKVVEESDEKNNCRASATQVTVSP